MNIEDDDDILVNYCTNVMLNFDLNEEESISYERIFGDFDASSSLSARGAVIYSPQPSRNKMESNHFCKGSPYKTESALQSISPCSVSSQHLFSPESFKSQPTFFSSTNVSHYEAYKSQRPITNIHPLKVYALPSKPSLFLRCDESVENNGLISDNNSLCCNSYAVEESAESSLLSSMLSVACENLPFKRLAAEVTPICPKEPHAGHMTDNFNVLKRRKITD